MKKRIGFVLGLFVVFVLVSGPVFAEEVAIPGTGDGVDVLSAIGNAFTQETKIEVLVPKSIGSGGAVKVVGTDRAILGRVARGIKENEKEYGLEYKAVFEVPTAIFVNNSVTIDSLTEQQVLDIFSGKINTWKDVGGSDVPIVVIRREDKDSSLGNLKKTFPGFKDMVFTENSTLAEKTFIMVAQIVNRPDSIGFGPLDVANANNLKALSINGKKPTDADYPYFGTIGLVYKAATLDKISKDFIDFALSAARHDIIVQAGGRPVK